MLIFGKLPNLHYTRPSFWDNVDGVIGVTPMWKGGLPCAADIESVMQVVRQEMKTTQTINPTCRKIVTLHNRLVKYIRRTMPLHVLQPRYPISQGGLVYKASPDQPIIYPNPPIGVPLVPKPHMI
eukprot:scaffold680008_cov74-Prasinocladus_malaysianus.AAC.1